MRKERKKIKSELVLEEIKEAVGTMKSIASDTSSKDILNFLKEESARQSERDDAFLKLMTTLIQQQPHASSSLYPPTTPTSFQQLQNRSSPQFPQHSSPSPNQHESQASQSNQYFFPSTPAQPFRNLPHRSSPLSQNQAFTQSFTGQLMNPDYP